MRPLPHVAFALLMLAPLFFLCYEVARILGCPESWLRGFQPWVRVIMAMVAALTALFVPWIASLLGDQDRRL